MTTVDEILAAPRDILTVRQVFGDPLEQDGTLVIPAARIIGGAGGGLGPTREDAEDASAGGGFGLMAWPTGVYVVRDGEVDWKPALDVTLLGMLGIGWLVLFTLAMRSVLVRRRER